MTLHMKISSEILKLFAKICLLGWRTSIGGHQEAEAEAEAEAEVEAVGEKTQEAEAEMEANGDCCCITVPNCHLTFEPLDRLSNFKEVK